MLDSGRTGQITLVCACLYLSSIASLCYSVSGGKVRWRSLAQLACLLALEM